ncbi:AEC family transporter [Flagellatimonas centrodinii]|uniref:AEC family transporter n=1 Tax=Flagellatimonas centrodinii TaxID=2806210 RepID=UPI001FEE8BB3|nr:AEC family transporter [Flagellatimonas centrodinii]ULQ47212.1 AEC family transporter [Flagellatimonas centrodinii]
MSAFLLLIGCLALGAGVARYAHPPIGLAQALNWWVIQIALPALILDLVPGLQFDASLWFLVLSQWGVFVGAWVLIAVVGAHLGWSRASIGGLILVCGLGNTSFMGYPLLEMLRGREGLSLGVVADQLGCFIMLAVGGVLVASVYGGARATASVMLRRVLLFPAFLALVAGVLVGAAGGWPAWFEPLLQRIGGTLVPLALFSVGLRFRLHLGRDQWQPVAVALSWKLLLAPVLALGLGVVTGVTAPVLSIGVLQTAMAPMISAAILADQHRLDPPLANTVLGCGILLSLVTVPLWSLVLP